MAGGGGEVALLCVVEGYCESVFAIPDDSVTVLVR